MSADGVATGPSWARMYLLQGNKLARPVAFRLPSPIDGNDGVGRDHKNTGLAGSRRFSALRADQNSLPRILSGSE